MTTTSVPPIVFTPQGVVLPTQSAILAGVQADINSAFGGGVNPGLSTPQGQIASSEAAVISEKNNEIAYIVNQVDPQYAEGRWQDAIGRIYFLTRIPAAATAVQCTLTGIPNTVIPVGTLAQDTNGNTYASTAAATIGANSSVSVEFQNIVTGPIACASGTLIQVYQLIPGWDSITNPADGVLGSLVESRSDFEYRRENSVAINSIGSVDAIYANVFAVQNVLDVYVIDNSLSPASFTGAISGTTLTVSAVAAGTIGIGSIINGQGITANTFVTAILTGTGQVGTYTVNHSQSVSSEVMHAPGVVMGVTNYPMVSNSLYVAVVGGLASAIAQAIWEKKDVGCSYNGNTSVIVTDNAGYSYPPPSYNVLFNIPTPVTINFSVDIENNSSLPSNIVTLVQAAVTAQFTGANGNTRERIGSTVLAGRYYAPISAVAANVSIVSVLIGTSSPVDTSISVGIDQVPTLGTITVNLV